jgi:hypothetical protein
MDGEREFRCPQIILCEGMGDKAFLEHLIEKRQIARFYVTFPNQASLSDPGGRDGFTRRLKALKLFSDFDKVTDLVVVSDNDDDPPGKFARVRELIGDAGGFSIPVRPGEMVAGTPRVGVFMLPGTNVHGQLETLCLESCTGRWPAVAACVDRFVDCNPHVQTWSHNNQERMRMRALISSICGSDPYTGLPYAWSRAEDLIPLDHACFDPLATFLKSVSPQKVALPIPPQ